MQPLPRRSKMLMLMGPSTCARCYFMPGTILLFPQRQMLPSFRLASLQLVPGRCSRQRSSGQSVPQCLSLQACPHPYHTFCPHIPRLCSPISLHRLVQTCYSINQIPPTQSQLDASLCMPLGPYPAQAGAQKVQQGRAQSHASEEGPPQAPARAGFQQETRQSPGRRGRYQVDHKPAMCPCH